MTPTFGSFAAEQTMENRNIPPKTTARLMRVPQMT